MNILTTILPAISLFIGVFLGFLITIVSIYFCNKK
jgi:hypothetical protein